MPCSFGLLPHPRSGPCAQPDRLLEVTVTDRWIPLVTAAYGTWVARLARTMRLDLAATASGPDRRVRPASVTRRRVAKGPEGLAPAGWGDSDSAPPPGRLPFTATACRSPAISKPGVTAGAPAAVPWSPVGVGPACTARLVMGMPQQIGYFDEHPSLRYAGEDNEWAYRALQAGLPIVYGPTVGRAPRGLAAQHPPDLPTLCPWQAPLRQVPEAGRPVHRPACRPGHAQRPWLPARGLPPATTI